MYALSPCCSPLCVEDAHAASAEVGPPDELLPLLLEKAPPLPEPDEPPPPPPSSEPKLMEEPPLPPPELCPWPSSPLPRPPVLFADEHAPIEPTTTSPAPATRHALDRKVIRRSPQRATYLPTRQAGAKRTRARRCTIAPRLYLSLGTIRRPLHRWRIGGIAHDASRQRGGLAPERARRCAADRSNGGSGGSRLPDERGCRSMPGAPAASRNALLEGASAGERKRG